MANSYDAWENKIIGPLALMDTQSANEFDQSASGSSPTRPGYTSPTPDTTAANSLNSNDGRGQLPHDFSQLGLSNSVIATGVYYHLIPKEAGGSKHIMVPKSGYWFPVTGDSPVDYSFTHQWDQADNLVKKVIASVSQGSDIIDMAARGVQHKFGGSFYVSGCSIFNSSAPPTISVQTKLFSSEGDNLMGIVEALRADTHARLGGGQSLAGSAGNAIAGAIDQAAGKGTTQKLLNMAKSQAGAKIGSLDHPGWWDVEVISFAGEDQGAKIISSMVDMICVGMKVTMYSPFVGLDPSYMEIRMEFQHAYPGLAESMAFGNSIIG